MSSPINRVNCRIPQETPILKSLPERTHNGQNYIAPQKFILYLRQKNERHDETAYIYIYIYAAQTSAHTSETRAPGAYIYIYIRRIPRRIPFLNMSNPIKTY